MSNPAPLPGQEQGAGDFAPLHTAGSTPVAPPASDFAPLHAQPVQPLAPAGQPVNAPASSFGALREQEASQQEFAGLNQETPRQTILRVSPNATQAAAKLDTAAYMASRIGIDPIVAHENFDLTAQGYWGDQAKGQPPTNILQKAWAAVKMFGGKVGNTWQEEGLQSQLNTLNAKLMENPDQPDVMAKREELKKEIGQLGPTLGWIPKGILDIAYQMGLQAKELPHSLAEETLSILTLEGMRKAWGWTPESKHLEASAEASQRIVGSISGSAYGAMIDRGIDPSVSRVAAVGIGTAGLVLQTLPVGLEGSKLASVLLNGTTRAALNGSLDMVLRSVPAELLGQSGLAIGMSFLNTMTPEIAAVYSNVFKGTEVPYTPAGELAKETALGAVPQIILTGSQVGLRTLIEHVQTRGVEAMRAAEAAEQRRQAAVEAEPTKPAEPVVSPDHPTVTGAKADLAKATIGDVLENEPRIRPPAPEGPTPAEVAESKVVTGKPTGIPPAPEVTLEAPFRKLTEEQGRKLDEATRSEEGSADYISQHPVVRALDERIEDLQRQIAQLDSPEAERAAAKVEKAAGRAGQTVESLRSKLETARDQAKTDRAAAVTALREHIKVRAQVNKDIADIRKVTAGAQFMNRDLGDAVKALADKIETVGRTPNAARGEEFMSEMAKLKDAIYDKDDPAANYHRGPTLDPAKLDAVSKVRARDLSPEDLHTVADAFKNLVWIQKMRDKVETARGQIRMEDLRQEAQQKVHGLHMTPAEEAKANTAGRPGMGTALKRMWRDFKSNANTAFSSYSYNGEVIFGKDSDLYRSVTQAVTEADGRREPHANRLQAPVMDAWLQKTMKINRRSQPAKYIAYATKLHAEDGFTLSHGEVMSAFMHKQNENNWASLLAGAAVDRSIDPNRIISIPEETYQKFFDNHLSAEEKRMMLEVAARDLKASGDERAAEFEARYGYPMSREENYWPKYVVRGARKNAAGKWEVSGGGDAKADIDELRKSLRWVRAAPDESHSIARTGSTGPIRLRNFWEVYPEIMADTANVVEMGPVVGEAGKVLWDRKISQTVADRAGSRVLGIMRDDLKYMSGQDNTAQGWERAVDGFGNVITNINLAFNLKSGIKQAMLAFRSFNQVSTASWLKGMFNAMAHPKATREVMRTISNFVDTAQRRGGTIEQAQLLRSEGSMRQLAAVRGLLQRAGMWVNKKGTQISFLLDASAAKEHAMMEFDRATQGKPFLSDDFRAATGLTEDQAKALDPSEKLVYAGKFADSLIGETHASAARAYEVGMQKWSATRLITKFQSEPMKAFEVMRRSLIQAHRNPSPFNIIKATKTMAFYTIAEGALFYGLDWTWNAMFGNIAGTEKQIEERAPKLGEEEVLTNLDYVPVIGPQLAAAVERKRFPQSFTGNVAGTPGDLLVRTLQAMGNIGKGNEAQQAATMKRFLDGVVDLGLGVFGTSVRSPRSMYRGIMQRLQEQ